MSMDTDPPASVAIQEKLNLFADSTCMSMFGNEPLCLQLTELQDTANELYTEIDEYVKEKESEISRLTQMLADRPLTKQQEAAMNIKIQKLEAEVQRLNTIKNNYEQNMPRLIQSTQSYINSLVGGLSKKRKVGVSEEPRVAPSVGTQQSQTQFDVLSQKINKGLDDLSQKLQALTASRASRVDKEDAINQKRGELIKLVNDNSDVIQDEEANRLVDYINTETQGIYADQGFSQ